MFKKTNNELKRIAAAALENEFGYAPKVSSISLLEACEDGTYIRFTVNNRRVYAFNSTIDSFGAVWAGNGTIEKVER